MANQNYGVTANGFIMPTLDDIIFDLQSDAQSSLPALSFGPNKVETAIFDIFGQQLHCMWQAILDSSNSNDVNFASGCRLRMIGARNGLFPFEGETDFQFRQRIIGVTSGSFNAFTGSSCFNDLQRDLLSISGVTDVQINLNDTPNQSGTLPPNSYEVMIIGGDSEAIGNAIWNNHPVGISHVGNTSFQITDCTGICRNVYFTRPKLVPIYLDIRVRRTQAICGCPTDDTSVICQNIYDFIQEDGGSCFTRIGQPLHVQDFFAPVFNIQGIGITCALMSRDGLCADNEMVTLKRDEVPFFNKECINVEFTSESSSPCVLGNYSCPSDECTFSLDIVKQADVAEFIAVGDTITYTYTVTNISSGVIVTPITITDDKVTVTCSGFPARGLPVGESITCMATYVATFEDAIAGEVTNKAQAVAGTLISPCVELTVPYTGPELFQSMTLNKSVVSGSCQNIGDVLTYQYTITNTGTVPIETQPLINDDKIGGIVCPPLPVGGLLPNSSISATAQFTVTQQVINSGECCNNARATATTALGNVTSNLVTVCVECGDDTSSPTAPTCPPNAVIDCGSIPTSIGGLSNVTSISTSPAAPSHTFTYDQMSSSVMVSGTGVNEIVTVTAENAATGESCSFDVVINGCEPTVSMTDPVFSDSDCPAFPVFQSNQATIQSSQTYTPFAGGDGPFTISSSTNFPFGITLRQKGTHGYCLEVMAGTGPQVFSYDVIITGSSGNPVICSGNLIDISEF